MNDISGTSNWFFKATSAGFKIRDNTNLLDVISIEKASLANSIYIKAGGNIGLATTNPLVKLDVNGELPLTVSNDESHGPKFQQCMVDLATRGALHDLW